MAEESSSLTPVPCPPTCFPPKRLHTLVPAPLLISPASVPLQSLTTYLSLYQALAVLAPVQSDSSYYDGSNSSWALKPELGLELLLLLLLLPGRVRLEQPHAPCPVWSGAKALPDGKWQGTEAAGKVEEEVDRECIGRGQRLQWRAGKRAEAARDGIGQQLQL